ncbi:MAG: hypothetical protein R2942_02020 [Ignavibacteria bacterium]
MRGNSIFVGTYESGLLKSYDAGQTWTLDDAGIQFLGFSVWLCRVTVMFFFM